MRARAQIIKHHDLGPGVKPQDDKIHSYFVLVISGGVKKIPRWGDFYSSCELGILDHVRIASTPASSKHCSRIAVELPFDSGAI